jgi:hypothetical protein
VGGGGQRERENDGREKREGVKTDRKKRRKNEKQATLKISVGHF